MIYSVATPEPVYDQLRRHLLRSDGQEDLAFALWHPSRGADRLTAVISEIVEPLQGEREVHGNAAFLPAYFERALGRAVADGASLAFMHSHPRGRGWQGVSPDDDAAERGHAGPVLGATARPFVGLTMAGDGHLAARFWERTGRRTFDLREAETVRIVGDHLRVFFNDRLRPAPETQATQARSVSAWGPAAQALLSRLRVGVIGLGSVGSIVAEILARTGISHIRLMDFDSLEEVNLDRTLGATLRDVALARSKVEVAARSIRSSATASPVRIDPLELSVVEEEGLRSALDCDVLFSCVDRPWPRAVLNLLAYAHAIPVVDGGIVVRTRAGQRMLGAEWRAHIAAPGRRCLECLGQYDPGHVSAEREGYFDRPSYLVGLPAGHAIRRNENVFMFGAAAASLEALQFLSLVVSPGGVSNVGAQMQHITTGRIDLDDAKCEAGCPYSSPGFSSRADDLDLEVTGRHDAADHARAARGARQREPRIRFQRFVERLLGQ